MRLLVLAAICLTAIPSLPAQAQTYSNSGDRSPVWEVHVHLQKAFASPLGQHLMQLVEREEPEVLDKVAKFAESIGLDPRTDIGEVVLFGNGFEESDVTVVASIGPSTGNLEGWILAAPGYRSEDLDDNTLLHSMLVEDESKGRAWFALPRHARSGNYFLVGSFEQNRTIELAQDVLDGNATPAPNPLQDNSLLSFFVNDVSSVPMDIDEDDPGSAILKVIDSIGLNLGSDEDYLSLAIDVSASSAGRARQISQLLVGVKALVQLAPLDEPEARKVAEVLETMVVSHTEGDSTVQASLKAPYRLLKELINEID
ncbi:MAG: hypothetical protein AAGD11_13585 [Planctomycetota bacterium]